MGSIRDITERHEQALALAARERELRLVTDHSADMIVRTGLDGVRRYVSTRSRTLLGYEPEDIINRGSFEGIHPEDQPALQALFGEAIQIEGWGHSIYRQRHRDGHYVWVEANYSVICDEATGLHTTRTVGMYQSRTSPRLFVIDKENGRKADAINCGLSYAQTPLVCVIDADSMIEPDGLLRAAEPFMTDDGGLVAVGGAIRIANGCHVQAGQVLTVGVPRGWIPRFQTIEYLRAFLISRIAASHWSTLTLISGAFGVFRRSTLVEIGGYRHDTVGEDLEVITRLHRHCREQRRPYHITFVPEIVCWTEAPATLGGLRNQRARWQQGALETIIRHRSMIGRPRYGRIGLVALPIMILEDVICPPLEVLGYVLIPSLFALGLLAPEVALSFLALSVLFGIFLSLGALIHEEIQVRRTPSAAGLAILALAAVVENLGYRQMNSAFRLLGMWRHLRRRTGWAAVPRAGFQAS